MTGRWEGHWHIIDTRSRASLESHFTEHAAIYFCAAVNAHEEKNGRETRYIVEQHSQNYRKPGQQWL